jgi:hypothetical protein
MCNAICYADSLAGKVRLPSFRGGAGSRIRTDDLLITNQLLYQLSYAGKKVPLRLGAPESSAESHLRQQWTTSPSAPFFCWNRCGSTEIRTIPSAGR